MLLQRAWKKACDTLWENRFAALFLQVIGGLLLVSYFFWEPTRTFWEGVGKLKEQGGLLYSGVSTALFGGLMPFLGQFLQPREKRDFSLKTLLFLMVFWAYCGMEIDLLYRLQALMFGTELSPRTVIPKVLVDQLIYSPLWAMPKTTIAYLWKDSRFAMKWPWAGQSFMQILETLLPVTLFNAMVWLPGVSMIYILPPSLQIPMLNLILCFWGLSLLLLTKK